LIIFLAVVDKDTLAEVLLVTNKDLSKLKDYIPPQSLEIKYGGDCPNNVKFWYFNAIFFQILIKIGLLHQGPKNSRKIMIEISVINRKIT